MDQSELKIMLETGMVNMSEFWDNDGLTQDVIKYLPYNDLDNYGKARYQAFMCKIQGKYDAAEHYLELAKRLEWS